ncbi:MAG: hypothetical protein IT557_04245 [Alphaproteobacteria bacterium]|nr:hypothetical protein [Alphaproteobacteria bacterium]
MAKRCELLFHTDRFNLTERKPHSINDSCFGGDVGHWLVERLAARAIAASASEQEDWGWYVELRHRGADYFIGITGNADDEAAGNGGEWRLMIERRRSLRERLTGANPIGPGDALVAVLRAIVAAEPGLRFIGFE